MYPEWLERRTTIEELEAKHSVRDDRLGSEPVPFGFMYKKWTRFTGQMQQGDELWEFAAPEKAWEHLAGRAGIALVRNGEIVDVIHTMIC